MHVPLVQVSDVENPLSAHLVLNVQLEEQLIHAYGTHAVVLGNLCDGVTNLSKSLLKISSFFIDERSLCAHTHHYVFYVFLLSDTFPHPKERLFILHCKVSEGFRNGKWFV